MKKFDCRWAIVFPVASLALVAGCAASPSESEDMPDLSVDQVDVQVATVTSSDNWVLTANRPTMFNSYELGDTTSTYKNNSSVFNTHKGGGCVVIRDGANSCTNDASCGTSPTLGYRYCMKADGDSAKRCYAKAAQDTFAYCVQGVLIPLAPGASTTLQISSSNWNGPKTYYNLSVISQETNCTATTCTGCRFQQENPAYCLRTLSSGRAIQGCGYGYPNPCP